MRPPLRPDLRLDPYPMPAMEAAAVGDRLVLSVLPDAILILDSLALIRDTNPAAERLFGRPVEQLRSTPLDRLVAFADGAGVGAFLRAGRLNGPERWSGCHGRGVDGQEFGCDVTAVSLPSGNGAGRWVVQVMPTATRDFQLTQRQESAKMSAVATLAAGIANDFNNALAAISASIEAARLRIISQDRVPPRELLDVKEATRGAARLVRRLLNFARPSPGIRRPLDPARVVEEASQVLSHDLDPRVTLVTRLEHGDWRIRADLEQLTDLLVSLGHNALDAMPGGGVLTLATARAAGAWGQPEALASKEFVRIEVRDTGRGIPPEVLPRIFEPFFTTKESGRGSGLGLATAYAILSQHEGGITVESAPEAGSLFQIYLPRSHDPVAEVPVYRSMEPGIGRGTILLVDDEASVRRPLRQALGLCGYTVLEACDGPEALRRHGQSDSPCDLVVLDVKMPGMSGWDVLAELKRRNPRLPVILTSGYTREDSTPPMNASTPDAYIPKPYDLAELTEAVRRLLRAAAPDYGGTP